MSHTTGHAWGRTGQASRRKESSTTLDGLTGWVTGRKNGREGCRRCGPWEWASIDQFGREVHADYVVLDASGPGSALSHRRIDGPVRKLVVCRAFTQETETTNKSWCRPVRRSDAITPASVHSMVRQKSSTRGCVDEDGALPRKTPTLRSDRSNTQVLVVHTDKESGLPGCVGGRCTP